MPDIKPNPGSKMQTLKSNKPGVQTSKVVIQSNKAKATKTKLDVEASINSVSKGLPSKKGVLEATKKVKTTTVKAEEQKHPIHTTIT